MKPSTGNLKLQPYKSPSSPLERIALQIKEPEPNLLKIAKDIDLLTDIDEPVGDAGTNELADDQKGNSLLILAAKNGKTEIVRLLLAKGADIHKKNSVGWNAIVFAAFSSRNEITFELLVANGADISFFDPDMSWSLLHFAVQGGNLQIVRYLTDRGLDATSTDINGETPIHFAMKLGDYKVLDNLLERAKKSSKNLSEILLDGDTLLHTAVKFRKDALAWKDVRSADSFIEAVISVIRSGVDLNKQNKDGNTALHIASSSGDYESAAELLDWGVDATIKNQQEKTALQLALENEARMVVRLMRLWDSHSDEFDGNLACFNLGIARKNKLFFFPQIEERQGMIEGANKSLNDGEVELIDNLLGEISESAQAITVGAPKSTSESAQDVTGLKGDVVKKPKIDLFFDLLKSILDEDCPIEVVHQAIELIDQDQSLVSKRNANGQCPIHFLLDPDRNMKNKEKAIFVINKLIDKGASSNARDISKDSRPSPFHYAAYRDMPEVLSKFMVQEASRGFYTGSSYVDRRNYQLDLNNKSALSQALAGKAFNAVKFLIENGEKFSIDDTDLIKKLLTDNLPSIDRILAAHSPDKAQELTIQEKIDALEIALKEISKGEKESAKGEKESELKKISELIAILELNAVLEGQVNRFSAKRLITAKRLADARGDDRAK